MLSIIIPAFNEEDNIAGVVKRVETTVDVACELVVVNDHSSDNTRKIVESLQNKYANLRLIDNNLPKGFANAVKSGFYNASGDTFIPVMGDLCDDLSAIKPMLEKVSQGYDLVCASRYIKGGARLGGSRLKGFLSCLAGWSLHFLLGIPTHDIANAFKMYRRKVIESIKIEAEGFEISMEIPIKAYYSGFRITEIPTVWRERTRGKSSFRILMLFPSYAKIYLWALFKRMVKICRFCQ